MKLQIVLLLVLITAKSQLQAADIYHALDFSNECFVSYLKQQSCSDEYLNSITAIEISEACENGVYVEKENLLEQSLLTFASKENFVCIKVDLRKDEKFKNLLLNLRVAKSISNIKQKISSLLTGTVTLKQKAIDRIERQLRDISSRIEVKCDLSVEFANLFDSYFEPDSEEFTPYDDIQEYCIKKELEANKLIVLEEFRIPLNPSSPNFDRINCSKIIESMKTQFIEEFNLTYDVNEFLRGQCVIATLSNGNDYIYLMLKAELISKYNLPRDQRSEEKEKFVNKMVELTMKVREKCS